MSDAAKMPSRDTTARTLMVALVTALVCSAAVTSVAITLKPIQQRNVAEFRQANILSVVGLLKEDVPVSEQIGQIDTRIVELATGEYTSDIDAQTFDEKVASKSPDLGRVVPAENDLANLRRVGRYSPVYLVAEGDKTRFLILPIRGAGLWAEMLGFIALEADGNTIRGLKFYQHGETPGLGDAVDRQDWQDLWQGKLVYDDSGVPQIEIIRGRVARGAVASDPPRAGDPVFQVDGMSGATLTGQAINRMLHFWLGPEGYGPYLRKNWIENHG